MKRAGILLRAVPFLLRAVPVVLLALTASSGASAMDRADLTAVLKTIPPNGPFWEYGNVVMRGRTRKAGVAAVVFPHWSHRARYTCRVCHQELGFSMRRGYSGITRDQYLAGKFCGACHDGTTAFTAKDGPQPQCKKCHMENTKDLAKKFAVFSASLPLAPFGNGIDWAAAIKEGSVRPNNFLYTDATIEFPSNLKRPLKMGTASPRSEVDFSHADHFAELDCSSCHPDIFNIKRKTTASFSMDSNIYGSFCGACHMLVAFPMNDCRRCHKSMSNSAY
jgi:c(7)-type cytochrome triheme protein